MIARGLLLLLLASGATAQTPADAPVATLDSTAREWVEVQPVLIGGLDGLQQRVLYPEAARRAGIDGTVFVRFVVDETGYVDRAACVRVGDRLPPHPLLCQAALDAVRASVFRPGIQGGVPVRVVFTLPVTFALRGRSCLGF
jgi:protein TonB